jgi:glycosyltransferase involved in cell wall biosynthesis
VVSGPLSTSSTSHPADFSVSAFQNVSISADLPSATFAGFLNQGEISKAYVAADCLVLPSVSETWGLAVNEGMACGLPAVVSDAAGCAPDLIDEGKTGFTFPVGDTAQLANRLAVLREMKQRGHDFRPALAEKMRTYSVESAVNGTLKAVDTLAPRAAEEV